MIGKLNIKSFLETIGAASIVAGLFFVGLEVRQNTLIAQNQAYTDYSNRITTIMIEVATDEYLPLLFARIGNGETSEDFSPEEQIRLRNILSAAVRGWEGVYRSVDLGILPNDILGGIGAGSYVNNAYFRSLWPEIKVAFTEDFIEFFEERPWNR